MNNFSKTLPLLGLLFFLNGCDVGSDPYPIREAIFSNSEDKDFEKVILLINLKSSDGGYVVAPTLFDVVLKLNDKPWGSFATSVVDTSLYRYSNVRGLLVTPEKLSFLMMAEKESSIEGETTAGTYASLLNSLQDLAPGDYILELAGLKFRNAEGSIVEVRTRQLKSFTVSAGSVNAYLGEFEVNVEN